MADILLDLQINTGSSAADLVKINKTLKATREEIKKNGDESGVLTQKTLELSQQKRSLTKDLNDEIKFNKSLNGSNDQLRASLSILTKQYNSMSETQRESTAEGIKLGKQVGAITAKLKENESAVGDNRRNVGNYTNSIIDAFKALEDENKEIQDNIAVLKQQAKEVDKGSTEFKAFTQELVKQESALEDNNKALGKSEGAIADFGGALAETPFGGFISGIKATGKAFLANPIALIVTGIVGALALLKEAFTSTEEGQAELDKGLNIISATFSLLLKALRPVAKFLVDNLVKGFKAAASGVSFLADTIASGLDFIGADDAANAIRNTTNAIETQVKASIALSNAQAEFNKLNREAELIQTKALNDQELLRQARDRALDRENDIQKARKLGLELDESFNAQQEKELDLANKQLKIAQDLIDLEGESSDNLQLRTDANLRLLEIEERINGFRSEQDTFLTSLINEERARADAAVENANKIAEAEAAIEAKRQEDAQKKIEDDAAAEEARLAKVAEDLEKEKQIKAEARQLEIEAEQEAAEAKIAFDKAVADNKVSTVSDAVATVENLFGQGTAAAKVAALAQIAFDTAKAISALTSNSQTNPANAFTFGGAGLAQFAAGIAQITGNIARAKNIISSFAEGGVIQGNSHAQGGVPFTVNGQAGFEAEGGEVIINKKSSRLFAPLLSQINSYKGFGRKFQDGGVVSAPISAPITSNTGSLSSIFNADELANSIGNAVAQNTNIVLPVESLSEVQNNVEVIENTVTF